MNAGRAGVTLRCADGSSPGARRCADGSIVRAELDVRVALHAGDAHASALCASRRELAAFLDDAVRARFVEELRECAVPLTAASTRHQRHGQLRAASEWENMHGDTELANDLRGSAGFSECARGRLR
mgnify:CR=1 FL=1